LNKIADFYEKETDTTLKDAFAVMEPLFVLILGGLVAGVAVSILLPVFQMNNINFG
jgi:type IV pilus assembly protein PilC